MCIWYWKDGRAWNRRSGWTAQPIESRHIGHSLLCNTLGYTILDAAICSLLQWHITYLCSTLWSVCVFVGLLVYIHLYFGLYILWYEYVCVSVLVFDWTQGVRTTIASNAYMNCVCVYMYMYASVSLFSVYKCIGGLYACVWLNTRSGDHDSLMRRALLSNVISKFVSPIHSYLQQCPIHFCVSIHAFLHKYTASIQLCSTWVLVCNVTCVYQSQCGQVHCSPNVFTSWASADHKAMEAR